MEIQVVGVIRFDDHELNVYADLDEPLFMAVEIAKLIDYSIGNTAKMLEICEEDEVMLVTVLRPYGYKTVRRRPAYFVTELGLYNILSQSRKPIARKWRRVVHQQLIDMRRDNNLDIVEQFEEWDHALDDIYWDEETGRLMQSATLPGGDVMQVPVGYADEDWDDDLEAY